MFDAKYITDLQRFDYHDKFNIFRELINKKKARETEEENRRIEILAERKARIQDVTYRYQRGSAPKSHPTNHNHQRARTTRNSLLLPLI